MKITRVKIGLCDGDDRVKAYASITLDHCFVIHGLRLTHSKKGYFLFMPGRKRADGTYESRSRDSCASPLQTHASTASTTKNHNLLSWFAIDSERDSIV